MHKHTPSLLLLITVLLLTSAVTTAAETDKTALAIEYLELSKRREVIDYTIQTYAKELSGGDIEREKRLKAFFDSYMGWEKLETPFAQVVADNFTEAELQDINAFHKTTSGTVFANKSPVMAAELSKIMSANLKEALAAMQP